MSSVLKGSSSFPVNAHLLYVVIVRQCMRVGSNHPHTRFIGERSGGNGGQAIYLRMFQGTLADVCLTYLLAMYVGKFRRKGILVLKMKDLNGPSFFPTETGRVDNVEMRSPWVRAHKATSK
ncbi:hypothetical protein TNCV_3890541 [Trichonephila clavipes]|nr:hypothetical protein TNCV_3890541 [Trichonephila clavipes]